MLERRVLLALCAALALASGAASAAVSPVGVGAFGAGSSLVSVSTLPSGTEVNGLSFGGLSFGYSLGNGLLSINTGPGATNNVGSPSIVSVGIGSNAGVLSVALPGLSTQFGYGFALLAEGAIPDATTATIFNGATNVGALSFAANAGDPSFPGGFAGIASTLPFDNVQLTFNSIEAAAFAANNFRVTPVPEAPTVVLLALGVAALVLRRQAAWKP